MSLPKYNKANVRRSFPVLPKGAYVIKIKSVKEDKWPSGDPYLRIAFDIAEGEYKDFYQNVFDADTREDKKWPFDAVYSLSIPNDDSQDYIWTNYNTFFANLEDSNKDYSFDPDNIKKMIGKVIGGKFRIRQSEAQNGNIYNHTELRWVCLADDVRNGKAGQLPADKLVSGSSGAKVTTDNDGFMEVKDGLEEELPF